MTSSDTGPETHSLENLLHSTAWDLGYLQSVGRSFGWSLQEQVPGRQELLLSVWLCSEGCLSVVHMESVPSCVWLCLHASCL